MELIPSVKNFYNSKLYFSKIELTKILNCYSIGVSRGRWKDYAIFFGKQKTSFYMYKHSLVSPDCILTKSKKLKKNIFFFDLEIFNNKKSNFNKIDDLIALLIRKEFKLL